MHRPLRPLRFGSIPRYRSGAPALLLLVASLACATQTPSAICGFELATAAAAHGLEPDQAATGTAAATLLRAAVTLVEPALPPLVTVTEPPLPVDAPGADAVSWLAARRLLPLGWGTGPIDAATWQRMLAGFEGWYGLDPPPPTPVAPATVTDLLDGLAASLGRVAAEVRPAALIASDAEDPDRLAFVAIVWNWTVYPRLLVLRPPEGVDLRAGPGPILATMASCAVRPRHYLYAPEPTARQLFQANHEGSMYVVGSEPDTGRWPVEVADGAETAFFGFAVPELDGVAVYSAVFAGPQMPPARLLRLLPRIRTNMGPTALLSYLRTP